MNETTVTVVGMVCSEIRYAHHDDAAPTARFQIRNTPRHFDKRTNTWTNGDPSYFNAICYRTLADHVASSMGVGDPVVATGRLRITRWRRSGENIVTADLDIQAIGHDLRWGTTVYRRATPPGGPRIPGPTRRRDEALATAGSLAGDGTSELELAGTGASAGMGVGAGAGAVANASAGACAESGAGAGAGAAARAGAATADAAPESPTARPTLVPSFSTGTSPNPDTATLPTSRETSPSNTKPTPTEPMNLPTAA